MSGTIGSRSSETSFDACDAVAVALRLAYGVARPDDVCADWSLVFDAASRELLAPLGWARSGSFIRQHAEGDVAAAWRRAAMGTYVRGERQLELLRSATAALDAAGVDAIVLKGLPLGARLYGDPFVRSSADIDLYVWAPERDRAAAALGAIGWRSTDGVAPWHESWSVWRGDVEYHLELHSSLVSDHLAHLNVPSPAAALTAVGGAAVWAHAGDFVAPYLATHLATHQLPPLVWLVDFSTLWSSLTLRDRGRAEAAAVQAGLGRYLAWACERARLVERAAADDREALGALGVDSARRRDVHSVWRHIALAASATDRIRVVGAFLVPRRARGSVRSLVRYTAARLRTRLGSVAGASRTYGSTTASIANNRSAVPLDAPRPLRVEREEMLELTREVVDAGGALRVRAPGGSMIPTIPRGALVRIGPVPVGGISRGDVVLALTGDGEPVLHRAVAVGSEGIVMRGDAATAADPPVPLDRVIGVATHVRDGGSERELGRRPRHSIAASALKMRRRLARMVRRDR